jgi:hypothetical protein
LNQGGWDATLKQATDAGYDKEIIDSFPKVFSKDAHEGAIQSAMTESDYLTHKYQDAKLALDKITEARLGREQDGKINAKGFTIQQVAAADKWRADQLLELAKAQSSGGGYKHYDATGKVDFELGGAKGMTPEQVQQAKDIIDAGWKAQGGGGGNNTYGFAPSSPLGGTIPVPGQVPTQAGQGVNFTPSSAPPMGLPRGGPVPGTQPGMAGLMAPQTPPPPPATFPQPSVQDVVGGGAPPPSGPPPGPPPQAPPRPVPFAFSSMPPGQAPPQNMAGVMGGMPPPPPPETRPPGQYLDEKKTELKPQGGAPITKALVGLGMSDPDAAAVFMAQLPKSAANQKSLVAQILKDNGFDASDAKVKEFLAKPENRRALGLK